MADEDRASIDGVEIPLALVHYDRAGEVDTDEDPISSSIITLLAPSQSPLGFRHLAKSRSQREIG
jgi:hypothetical protein